MAPGVAELAHPGQFVALAVGGPTSANLLRRCFSIHRVKPSGTYGGTVDVVVAAHGPGTVWLTGLRAHDPVDVVGPLGRPFPLPAEPVAVRARRRRLRLGAVVLAGRGAARARLLGRDGARRGLARTGCSGSSRRGAPADGVTVTTDDGSSGRRGWVSDVLGEVIDRTAAGVVYGCGPMAMLRSVTEIATAHGAVAQVAVEESMACGVGVCMTCVLPVTGNDGVTRMVRSCVEGPVFRGDRVRWDAFGDGIGRVPGDALGAPRAGGS